MTITSDTVSNASERTHQDSPSDFASLLDREFKPKTDEARDAVEAAVRTLAEQALLNAATMTDDAYSSIEAIIAEIDRKLSEQINLVLHKDDFQKVESAWRGMHHLVYNTETDEKLKIRFMDLSKDEMRRTLRRHKGIAWDQSPVFKRIYEEEYGQLGGEPYGCLVADYYFDHTPPDVELLGAIARISAASHAPFISGSAPSLLGMESWQELANPRDLAKITSNLEHAPWNACAAPRTRAMSGLPCRAFFRACPTVPRPTRSTSSTSRKKPRAPTTATTCGATPHMPWPSTSTAASSSTAGAP
jgi:type VI secretion system protein ImpC